jgi:hypothetical protein
MGGPSLRPCALIVQNALLARKNRPHEGAPSGANSIRQLCSDRSAAGVRFSPIQGPDLRSMVFHHIS